MDDNNKSILGLATIPLPIHFVCSVFSFFFAFSFLIESSGCIDEWVRIKIRYILSFLDATLGHNFQHKCLYSMIVWKSFYRLYETRYGSFESIFSRSLNWNLATDQSYKFLTHRDILPSMMIQPMVIIWLYCTLGNYFFRRLH